RWARGRDRARSAGSGLLPGEWHKSPVSDINLLERRAVGLAVREGTEVPTGHLFPGEWHKSHVVDINPLERRAVGLAVRGDTEVPTGSPPLQMAQIASRGDQPYGTTRGGFGGRTGRRSVGQAPAPGEWHKSRVAEINPMERRRVGLAAGRDAAVPTRACSGRMAQIASRGDQPYGM